MGSSESSSGVNDSYNEDKMRYEHKAGDSFQDSMDKVLMNRVLSGDEPSNPAHFIMDNLRAADAFRRASGK